MSTCTYSQGWISPHYDSSVFCLKDVHMAKRRMFSMDIIDTDIFLELPSTAQLLYFHLSMRADDDGFISAPKRIIRLTGASEGDLKVLIDQNFIIPFKTGVCVITHWKIHNYIQSDRYHKTIYKNELLMLKKNDDGVYSLDTERIPNGYRMDTEVRLVKDSLDKVSVDKESQERKEKEDKPKSKFKKPTIEELKEYASTISFSLDAEKFFDYYESKGWLIGKSPMKDWKATVRNWKHNQDKTPSFSSTSSSSQPKYTKSIIEEIAEEEERERLERM